MSAHRIFALFCGPLLFQVAAGNVYTYTEQPLDPDVIQYRRVGMYAPDDSPHVGPPGNGQSVVQIDVLFSRVSARESGLIQLLMLHSDALDSVGFQESSRSSRTYCCTTELRDRQVDGCASVGSIIVSTRKGSGAPSVWMQDVTFAANQSSAQLSAEFHVETSGVHYLLLSSCEPRTSRVLLGGSTVWLQPYGHLPAELYALLPFFGLLSLFYLFLGVLWATLCARYWRELLPLQLQIGGVIALSLLEAAALHFDYETLNATGLRGRQAIVLGVCASSAKKTVSRLIVLVVSLGYGVVRPSLGSMGVRVAALGVGYGGASAVLDTVSSLWPITDLPVSLRLLLIVPVALEATIYWWVFTALGSTLEQLASRKQSAKLTLYSRFSKVLVLSVGLSAAWVTWQMVVIVSDSLDDRWESLWFLEAFWHLLHASMLSSVAFLWSPSNNNLQYAYSDELVQDETEADGQDEAEDGDERGAAAKAAAAVGRRE